MAGLGLHEACDTGSNSRIDKRRYVRSTARTVDGHHWRPPWAVGTCSSLSVAAIAASDRPASLHGDALGHRERQRHRPPEPHTARALGRQRLAGPLSDQSPLELGEGGQDARHRLASRRGRVQSAVQSDQGPALAVAMTVVKSSIERERRSSLATTSAPASPCARPRRTACPAPPVCPGSGACARARPPGPLRGQRASRDAVRLSDRLSGLLERRKPYD